MKHKTSQHEHGQILVILALALVGLLAFTALAIDVGMVFTDRRYDQNVADSSALAGAEKAMKLMLQPGTDWKILCNTGGFFSDPNQTAIKKAAVDRASTNNATISPDGIGGQNGVELICTNGSNNAAGYLDVHVMVSSVTPTSFAHVFWGGTLRNTVEAIARVVPPAPAGFGNNIIALLDSCGGNDGGLLFDGNTQVISYDGTMYTNWCTKNTSASTIVKSVYSTYPYNCIPDGIGYNDPGSVSNPWNENSCPPDISSPPVYIDYPTPANPSCPADFWPDIDRNDLNAAIGETVTLEPGSYHSIRVTVTKGNIRLKPGLYCIDSPQTNQGFVFTGGSIISLYLESPGVYKEVDRTEGCQAVSAGTPCGNTFWMKNGSFQVSGNGTQILAAATNDTVDKESDAMAVPGLLIGAPFSFTGLVNIEGTATDTFMGTIYVPHGEVVVGGNTTTNPLPPGVTDPNQGPSFNQILADRIKFHGTAGVNVIYNSGNPYTPNGYLELLK